MTENNGSVNYRQLCKDVCTLAMSTGDYLREERQKASQMVVKTKGMHDYVTQFDKESEYRIVTRLKELLPQAGFIAEEGSATNNGTEPFLWIVDPLDGTTNFIHGFPYYCVSIALSVRGRVEQAVVYDPTRNDLFLASHGRGAYLNNRRIRVSRRTQLGDSLLSTGFPFRKGDDFKGYH